MDVAGAYHAITQVLGEDFSQKNGAIAPGEKCDPALLADDLWKLYTERND